MSSLFFTHCFLVTRLPVQAMPTAILIVFCVLYIYLFLALKLACFAYAIEYPDTFSIKSVIRLIYYVTHYLFV